MDECKTLYTGKLAAMLIHTVPVAVTLHFAVAAGADTRPLLTST